MIKSITSLFVASIILMSCASSYKPIAPHRMSFDSKTDGDLNYAYRYHVLTETGNKKYANKETKHGVKLVAVEINCICWCSSPTNCTRGSQKTLYNIYKWFT